MAKPEAEAPAADLLVIPLDDEAATEALAARLAPLVRGGGRIYLHGDLGAGKTTLVRALLRKCGIRGRIKSPTYTLVEVYEDSSLYCYHFDFYRFQDPREWLDAGFRDLLLSSALILIEWPEKAGDLLPPADLDITLDVTGDAQRLATLRASSTTGRSWITALRLPAAPSP